MNIFPKETTEMTTQVQYRKYEADLSKLPPRYVDYLKTIKTLKSN
jgi:hypothetical protein